MHRTPSLKVYIGITKHKPTSRWKDGKGYKTSPHFKYAIEKYGWDSIEHIILFTGLSKEEAETKEIALISLFKSNDQGYGYNISGGGNAVGSMSEETKEKIGSCKIGKPRSEETKEKISKTRKEKYGDRPAPGARPVLQIDIITYEVVARYSSATEAGKKLGIDNSSISKACKSSLNKGRRIVGDYGWEYEDQHERK